MSSLLHGYNTSILAIPAYVFIAVVPHFLSVSVANQGSFSNLDNCNPRSSDLKARLKQRVPAETYAKYERMQACHANSMENFPLFIAAVILGNMAGLEEAELTTFVTYFLAVRVAFTVAYITTSTQAPTFIRSGLFIAGVSLCMRTIIRAAAVMGSNV